MKRPPPSQLRGPSTEQREVERPQRRYDQSHTEEHPGVDSDEEEEGEMQDGKKKEVKETGKGDVKQKSKKENKKVEEVDIQQYMVDSH